MLRRRVNMKVNLRKSVVQYESVRCAYSSTLSEGYQYWKEYMNPTGRTKLDQKLRASSTTQSLGSCRLAHTCFFPQLLVWEAAAALFVCLSNLWCSWVLNSVYFLTKSRIWTLSQALMRTVCYLHSNLEPEACMQEMKKVKQCCLSSLSHGELLCVV